MHASTVTHSLKDKYRYIHSSLFTAGISSGSYRSQEWPQSSDLEQTGAPRKALATQSFQRPETRNEAREREGNDISASSSLELCTSAALMSESRERHMSQLWLRTPFASLHPFKSWWCPFTWVRVICSRSANSDANFMQKHSFGQIKIFQFSRYPQNCTS